MPYMPYTSYKQEKNKFWSFMKSENRIILVINIREKMDNVIQNLAARLLYT